jgi:hypothetical protein
LPASAALALAAFLGLLVATFGGLLLCAGCKRAAVARLETRAAKTEARFQAKLERDAAADATWQRDAAAAEQKRAKRMAELATNAAHAAASEAARKKALWKQVDRWAQTVFRFSRTSFLFATTFPKPRCLLVLIICPPRA